MERDPFILTGLMWAWLEQLKEPVISVEVAKALNPENTDPQTVLAPLDQVSPKMICYTLNSPSHLTVLSSFHRLLKKRLHASLTVWLICILYQIRLKKLF